MNLWRSFSIGLLYITMWWLYHTAFVPPLGSSICRSLVQISRQWGIRVHATEVFNILSPSMPSKSCHLITWDTQRERKIEVVSLSLGLHRIYVHCGPQSWKRIFCWSVSTLWPCKSVIWMKILIFQQNVRRVQRSYQRFIYLYISSLHSLWSSSMITDTLSPCFSPPTGPIPPNTLNKPLQLC